MNKMSTNFRIIIAVCLVIIKTAGSLNAQTALTPEQIDRLYRIGQLWGHITYFHPYLQYKKIPFDSAYAAAIPGILGAKTDAELVAVLNTWLGILNDPITFSEITIKKEARQFDANFQDLSGTGILTLSGSAGDYGLVTEKLSNLRDVLGKSKALVIDLSDLQGDIGYDFLSLGIEGNLFSGTAITLGIRSVAHSGFVPETGATSGDYSSYFKSVLPKTIYGNLKEDRPTVFIVSSNTFIPEIANGMWNVGKAAIISNEPILDLQNASTYGLTDNITIHFRIKEFSPNGVVADAIVAKSDKTELIKTALEIIEKNVFQKRPEAPTLGEKLVRKTPNYPKNRYPEKGYRALAVAKMHSVVNYFFPNKKLMTVNWDSLVRVYLPLIVDAKDFTEYQLAVNRLYANIQDGHGGINGSLIPEIVIGGTERAPVTGSIVEGKYVITKIISDSLAKVCNVEIGDVILKRKGVDVLEIINKLKLYRAASNEITGARYASRWICSGADGEEVVFTIQKKNGKIMDLKLPFSTELTKMFNDNPSERSKDKIYRFLTPDIGYADLARLTFLQVDSLFELFKNTKSIVFDMRGYPKETAWAIAPRLTDKKNIPGTKTTRLVRDFPLIKAENNEIGETETWVSSIHLLPNPHTGKSSYKGKTVMLMNENTQSQAEFTGMFFYAANGTNFIGSQTAGANGDVTRFLIPGGMTLNFSGQTVSYPNGKQMQRIGLIPDVPVLPTIKGIQAGRDEVLEAAIRYLQKN